MRTLLLLRHGESVWNREGRFTGWTDIGLSERGEAEAIEAGRWLAREGVPFDVCHTSLLKRAIKTLWLVLEATDRMWVPVSTTWRLNERHYGALQGLDKAETAARFGDAQVFAWRRSFRERPPALDAGDPRFPGHDPRYTGLDPSQLPATESLADTIERVLPYWHETIAPQLAEGRTVLISAHGNSLRALVKYLERISDDDIPKLEIPTGVPIVYELDSEWRVESRRQP